MTHRHRPRLLDVDLDIEGMTCASCATGSSAAQQARRRRRVGQLRQRAGTRALPRRPGDRGPDRGRTPGRLRRRAPDAESPRRPRRHRRCGCSSRPCCRCRCVLWAMVPATRFAGWEWWSLAAVGRGGVVVRLAVPPRRRGQRAPRRQHHGHPGLARHRGRLALVGGRGRARRGPPLPRVGGRRDDVPARRPLRRGAEQAAGRRRAAVPAWSSARSRSACCGDGVERLVPVEQLAVGDRFVVRPGEKVATDGVVETGASAVDAVAAHRRARAGRGRPAATTVVGATVNAVGAARRPRHARRRRHPARPDRPAGRGGAARQGAGRAAGRPHLGGVRAGRAGDRARSRSSGGCSPAATRPRPSPRRSRCWSSPARARSAWPRRPR